MYKICLLSKSVELREEMTSLMNTDFKNQNCFKQVKNLIHGDLSMDIRVYCGMEENNSTNAS
jgi:hypothetical protein